MIWVYKYDDNYIWQAGKDILVDVDNGEAIPKGYTDKQPPDGLFIAKYDPKKEEWFEAASKEYIDSLQPDPGPPSDIELLKQQNADLLQQLAETEKRAEEQSKTTAELVMLLTEKGVI
ncbi:hypothetical protein BK049_05010 [Bacillus xiamenensis]|uniref:Bacteriophage SP-beta YorD domain-containing protein n=1 Tax=Bacillus xiamenensis TaxID=1178537 RepID=A0AAC9NBT5_9BACI|nr:hypothetical protein [Bacillus xiamenensis]AOZ88120.1 hypothetical protein BK049_05010 [Bacillus xiamenensis]